MLDLLIITYRFDSSMARTPGVVSMKVARAPTLARLRRIAKTTGCVIFTDHAKQRMEERGITNTDVFRVLRSGAIEEGPEETQHGDIKVKVVLKIRGSRDAGVVAVIVKNDRLIVVTVEWEDLS